MLRRLFRLVGFVAIALAFALLVKDATRSIAGGALALTPLGQDAATWFPAKFPLLQPLLERNLHPFLWDPVALALLHAPTWLALGLAGTLVFYAVRPRRRAVGTAGRP